MNPSITADLAVWEELIESLVALIRPLDEDCLNWHPLPTDTNSIAAMVTHTIGAIENWLARAVGEAPNRNRDAEFLVRASAADLLNRLEEGRATVRRRLAQLDGVDLNHAIPVRRLSQNREMTVTPAWCIEHALIHAGEHWGQIQLTAQLYAAR